ncbi:MAG: hypothetical protein BGP12_08285 [Rhodospirillales bacterium 70-18]|nr:MAG: hypothetical protein BGP12_08285 [Rhodospirillales bacterium 70-18]
MADAVVADPVMADAGPVTVRARCRWNDTGIRLEAGRLYDLAAEGEWIDWVIRSGPEGNTAPGWTQRLAARWLRLPGAPYFCLVGALDCNPDTAFAIGRGMRLGPPRSGQLWCFANDVPGMYWNNRGAVRLSLRRID